MAALERARALTDLRSWPLWDLPRWLAGFVTAVIAVYVTAVVLAVGETPFQLHGILVFALLLAFGVASTEITRRAQEPSGLLKEAHGVWHLAVAVLLPLPYALLAPIPVAILAQFRVRRGLVYRRNFSLAQVGLATAAASGLFHILAPAVGAVNGSDGVVRPLTWLALVTGCAVVRAAVNKLLVTVAVKGSEPAASLRGLLWDSEMLHQELAEICVAVLVAFAVAEVPLAIVLALPFGTLLTRSMRHTQLVSEARIDAKTGLLNAAAWHREAVTCLARAEQAGMPLAVALIDIDHFKQVNDRYGHLAGDQVLGAVTGAIRAAHRGSDLCGRFGGEEFVLLLPEATAAEARVVLERVRRRVAALRVPAGDGGIAQVTVSAGIAVQGEGCRQLTDLLAAADTALYYAKETGRDRVRCSPAPARQRGQPGRTTGAG